MIPLTNLHAGRVVDQIKQNLIGIQNDLRRNAMTHKTMALEQSPTLSTLQTFVLDCANQYLRRLQWLIDLRANVSRRTRLQEGLSRIGLTEADVADVATALRQAAIALRDAPRGTYDEIISACDSVIAFVDAPESLWPE